VEDWAEIRWLHRAEGMPIRAIVRKLGVGRNTVRRALAADGPPRYERPVKGSAVDAVEPQIRQLLAARDRLHRRPPRRVAVHVLLVPDLCQV
jgi:transposase